MTWQEIGVVLVVGGAIYYLARTFLWSSPRKKKSVTFVPLSSLKKPAKRR